MFDCLAVSLVIDAGSTPGDDRRSQNMVELPLALGLFDLTTKLFNLPNNRRRLAREKIWTVSAAALPGWLQVFASPHFSRLLRFYMGKKVP